MRNRRRALLLVAWLSLSAAAPPVAERPLSDPAQEAHALMLFKRLRCTVCEGQSVADSPAAVAQDLRVAVRRMVADGKNDAEIESMLTSRYGDAILMSPPLAPYTWILWFAPLLMPLVGGAVLFAYLTAGKIGERKERA